MAINFGDVLGGLGAAMGGTAQQYAQGVRQREQGLTEQKRAELEARQKAMYQDAGAAFQLLQAGDLDGIIGLAEDRLQLLQTFPDADPSDTMRVLQNAMAARDGDPMALRDLATELTSATSRGMAMGILQRPEVDERVLRPGDTVFRDGVQAYGLPAEAPQEPAAVQSLRIRAREAGLAPGTPEYSDFMRSGGGGGVSVTTNVQGPMDDKYLEGRASAQAATMAELEKSAESAYRANQALDRFITSSATGDAGGAQPLITGVKSFLSSFGYDPAGLTDTAVMQQAVGDILGAKMAELGARGLTDKDMEILRQALPRVDISHEARVRVADIIKRANQNTLREYEAQVRFEEETYPQGNFRRPSWLPGVREQLQQETPVNDPLGILQ